MGRASPVHQRSTRRTVGGRRERRPPYRLARASRAEARATYAAPCGSGFIRDGEGTAASACAPVIFPV
ncbi:hypothetical protein SZ55_0653 [Pseudomonas sp. FeS53a]|nr:hypothetical protein SZ55_0653 [Pseudomonas sp. FeS53a]